MKIWTSLVLLTPMLAAATMPGIAISTPASTDEYMIFHKQNTSQAIFSYGVPGGSSPQFVYTFFGGNEGCIASKREGMVTVSGIPGATFRFDQIYIHPAKTFYQAIPGSVHDVDQVHYIQMQFPKTTSPVCIPSNALCFHVDCTQGITVGCASVDGAVAALTMQC